MPAVCVFAPAVVAAWPAISAAVAGAAAALGMTVVREARASAKASVAAANAVEVAVEQCEVAGEALATEEQVTLVQGDVRVTVYRDERGQCRATVTGVGRSQEELRAIGQQVVQKLMQQLVYNKLMSELRTHGFNVVSEEVAQDGAVRLHVRHWEG